MRVYQRVDSVTAKDALANPNISDDLAAASASAATHASATDAAAAAAAAAAATRATATAINNASDINSAAAAAVNTSTIASTSGSPDIDTGTASTSSDATRDSSTILDNKARATVKSGKLPEDGLVFRHSGYSKANEFMNASRTFLPPCTTVARYSDKDKGKTSMLIYFVPTRPGNTPPHIPSISPHIHTLSYTLITPSHSRPLIFPHHALTFHTLSYPLISLHPTI